MVKEMIALVQADPCASLRSSYDSVTAQSLRDSAQVMDEAVQTFTSVQSLLQRHRSECFSPISRTRADVDVRREWSRSWNDESHMTLSDIVTGLLVFMTKANTKLLCDSDTIFIDWTFRTVPRPFFQLVTIHVLSRGIVVPVCFCLMAGKTIVQYRTLLSHISQGVRTVTNRVWNPRHVICDFEQGLITALRSELPGCRVRGCYCFYFTQSLWKKVSSLSERVSEGVSKLLISVDKRNRLQAV